MSVTVITGCSTGGIGEALCLEYAKRGHQVYATARNLAKMASLEKVKGITTVQADINDPSSLKRLVERVLSEAGHIDMLICNAGIGATGALLDIPLDNVRNAFETNVTGTLATCQAAMPSMIQRGEGKVVIIGSTVGVCTTPWGGTYCATKSAVHALANALRMETKPFGVQVSVVCPGGIRSNIASNQLEAMVEPSPKSPYADPKIQDSIRARASFSQRPDSTSSADFAKNVADMTSKPGLPAYFFTGKGSTILYLLGTWMPVSVSDWALSRQFGLNKIAPVTSVAS